MIPPQNIPAQHRLLNKLIIAHFSGECKRWKSRWISPKSSKENVLWVSQKTFANSIAFFYKMWYNCVWLWVLVFRKETASAHRKNLFERTGSFCWLDTEATPHKVRLSALHAICRRMLRTGFAQRCLDFYLTFILFFQALLWKAAPQEGCDDRVGKKAGFIWV